MIEITPTIVIAEDELSFDFIRSSGPGGQNVNKVATAVQLRFDVLHSPSLPDDVRIRLVRLAGRRLTSNGVLVITARRHRTQQQNRDDALERLVEMIRAAAVPPKKRGRTRPTAASRKRRLEDKRRKSRVKRMRKRVSSTDE
jgi:ribosome-associated protein